MALLTLIARASDGLPLSASIQDEEVSGSLQLLHDLLYMYVPACLYLTLCRCVCAVWEESRGLPDAGQAHIPQALSSVAHQMQH